jgi:hypothetical protein
MKPNYSFMQKKGGGDEIPTFQLEILLITDEQTSGVFKPCT